MNSHQKMIFKINARLKFPIKWQGIPAKDLNKNNSCKRKTHKVEIE